jgi:hypothetical protein
VTDTLILLVTSATWTHWLPDQRIFVDNSVVLRPSNRFNELSATQDATSFIRKPSHFRIELLGVGRRSFPSRWWDHGDVVAVLLGQCFLGFAVLGRDKSKGEVGVLVGETIFLEKGTSRRINRFFLRSVMIIIALITWFVVTTGLLL